uniref:trans-L-3-hydroxyproline dehydratase n=1 Tax=Chrysemys picta bellii TaxID=8478 RepID=A0A8C3ICF5_CHRPI
AKPPRTVPLAWLPPGARPVVRVVDMHTGGEPLRIVPGGLEPGPAGPTLLARRRHMGAELDHVRRLLVHEPRGHRDMYAAVLVPSELPAAQLGALFLHGQGYSTMCGHAVLALGRFALDGGLVPAPSRPETAVTIHCPCGPVTAFVPWDGQRSGSRVRFHSVPAFAAAADVTVDVPGHGKVVVDIGYGGAFYAFLSAERLGLDVCSSKTQDLVDAASAVTEAVKRQFKLHHPDNEELAFLYGTILTDGKDAFSDEPTTNICVEEPFKCQFNLNLNLFSSQEAKCGDYNAVVVEVSGEAFYTGTATFVVEEEDPLKYGFSLK